MSNLVEGRPAGAVDLGGSAQAASVGYPVGAIHFGPAWEDDSVQLTHKGWSQITDGMAKSIVRLECEAEELRAEVALLQGQARILAEERNEAREDAKRATYDAAQETIKVSTAKSHWIEACCERDHWKSESLEQAKLLAMSADREERLARERDEARAELEMWRDGNILHEIHRDELEKVERERDEARILAPMVNHGKPELAERTKDNEQP
jgi:multidrug efflux pump subunit AcrA (membrane-fusion protein)